jgi:hypothetical protein
MKIERTSKTPEVLLDSEQGSITLIGRSIPENSIEFYAPVMEWIEKYSIDAKPQTQFNIHLEYFNTSSSKCILDILKKLRNLDQAGKTKVLVNWYYDEDDEDMLEAGEDYREIVNLSFNMIPVKS